MYRKLKSKIEDLKYEISKDEKDDFIIIRKDEVGNTGWAEFKIKGEKKLKNLELKKKEIEFGHVYCFVAIRYIDVWVNVSYDGLW